jgi:DNA-binding transcriptional LysR family regulator
MVEQGIGISVMPSMAVPPMGLPALAVRPLLPKVQRSIMLVHRRNRAPAPLAQRVWRLIAEMAARPGADGSSVPQ